MSKIGHIERRCSFFLLLLMLLSVGRVSSEELQYPAYCRTTTGLNIRSGPGTQYKILNQLDKGDTIIIHLIEEGNNGQWGLMSYNQEPSYVAMRYVEYLGPYEPPAPEKASWWKRMLGPFYSVVIAIWAVLKVILVVLLVLLVLIFWEDILSVAMIAGFCAGGGALLFWIFGGDGNIGALVGLGVAALMGVVLLLDHFDIGLPDIKFAIVFKVAYYVVSFPVYLLNRLENFLVEPWRYIFKSDWVGEGARSVVRVILEILGVLMYIAITPLRLLNAIIYNIFIHCLTGVYDLLIEVLAPSDDNEGARGFWRWVVMLPWRVLKYLVWHMVLIVIESLFWTVMDVFVPARTMYHGTDLTAGNAIVRDPKRNKKLRKTSHWTAGTFTASQSSWGGVGVYFASSRLVAKRYATDYYRLDDNNPVVIVCRVSLGRTLNYSLAPTEIYRQTGQNGDHMRLTNYCLSHNYTTGEWWNDWGGYWEYCMLDRQNRYNHPWRIRPVYLYNFRTGRVQHITGGMQHWLFDSAVLKNLFGR